MHAKYFMGQVVRKEMLVCDCCLGSGTFLLALHQLNQERLLGCRFVGCDIETGCIKQALERLNE